jgi:hypothetical protein
MIEGKLRIVETALRAGSRPSPNGQVANAQGLIASRAERRLGLAVARKQRRAARLWAESAPPEAHARPSSWAANREHAGDEVQSYGTMRELAAVFAGCELLEREVLPFWRALLGYAVQRGDDVDYFARCADADAARLRTGAPFED